MIGVFLKSQFGFISSFMIWFRLCLFFFLWAGGGGRANYVSNIVIFSMLISRASDLTCPFIIGGGNFNHLVKVMSATFLHLKILFFPFVISKGNNLTLGKYPIPKQTFTKCRLCWFLHKSVTFSSWHSVSQNSLPFFLIYLLTYLFGKIPF